MTATHASSSVAVPAVGRPQGSDAVLLTVALVAVSTSGPLIAATAVPAMAIAFWCNAMAAGLLLPAVLPRCRDELRGLDRREKRLAALAGLLLALHFATWTPALAYTSVASATALVATQPVWAALIAFRQPLTGYDADAWVQLVALTLGAQLLGHSLLNRVLKTVGPTVVSLLLLLEIPGAAAIAAVFLGQRPPLLAVPAAVLLLVGLALVIRAGSRGTVPSVPVE